MAVIHPLSKLVDELRFELQGLANSPKNTANVLRAADLVSWCQQLDAFGPHSSADEQLALAAELMERAAEQLPPVNRSMLELVAITGVRQELAVLAAESKLTAALAVANKIPAKSADPKKETA